MFGPDPAGFLREGDHEFDEIFEGGLRPATVGELSTPAGVN